MVGLKRKELNNEFFAAINEECEREVPVKVNERIFLVFELLPSVGLDSNFDSKTFGRDCILID
jgi:hypothetical protein